ncbi:hypothetical protein J2852_004023 [Azospirillum soli]|nr:hypothetical protein [Azospirillum soli]
MRYVRWSRPAERRTSVIGAWLAGGGQHPLD